MAAFFYRTIEQPAQGLYKEKGSKFFSFAYPVETEGEIKEKLVALRKEYFDARHHCFAWVLGPDKKNYRASDDGEPNHAAGDPILGQIRSKDLTNVVVVVVRYFGGIKLGVGGLMSAYKNAAEDALNHAAILEKAVYINVTLRYDYAFTPDAMRLVKDFDMKITAQQFTDTCVLACTAPLETSDKLIEKVKLMNALGVIIQADIAE